MQSYPKQAAAQAQLLNGEIRDPWAEARKGFAIVDQLRARGVIIAGPWAGPPPKRLSKPKTQSRNGKYRKSNRVLFDERPLILLPSLARAVGVNGAIVIQQLHFYLANPDNGRVHDGERWIFNSYEQWHKSDFPFWSAVTIRRIFCDLEKRKLIASRQPEGRASRRKYYRINYGALEKAVASSCACARDAIKLIGSMRSSRSLPIAETSSSKTSALSKESSARKRAACSFSLDEYIEEERELIEDYHAIVCDNDSRWLRINRYTDRVRDALEQWTFDAEAFRELCIAAVNENGDCNIPKRRTLVALIWANY